MKLFVFGDSFSTNYTTDIPIPLQDSWPELLSKNLNCTLKNYASAGMCNGEIINRFIARYKEITPEDVVIIQTGFFSRILNPFTNSTLFLNDVLNKSDHKNQSSNTMAEYNFFIQYINNLDTYFNNEVLKFQFIFDFLTLQGNKFLIWSVDNNSYLEKYIFPAYKKHYVMYPKDWENITSNPKHWNGNDRHFNGIAHKYVSEIFYQKLL